MQIIMEKENIIKLIQERINSEYAKHKDLDWSLIAAKKIYNNLFEISVPNFCNENNFWIIAESWYKRTHSLRNIAENENDIRNKKALKLFIIMLSRMTQISSIAVMIKNSKIKIKYPKGGHCL